MLKVYIPYTYINEWNLQLCGWNISSRFSSNSEASASELLENREEMVPDY